MKCSYSFPHKSRQGMTDYLSRHDSYWPMNEWNGGFVISWNVKVRKADYSGNSGSEPINHAYDEQWSEHVEKHDHLFWLACEDAARHLLEGDYSTYPGDDGGSYEFMLNGRSGGHLCLMSCDIVPQPRARRFAPYIFRNRAHWRDYVECLSFSDLRKLYKAIACMDQDFNREKIAVEISQHFNFYRLQWEIDLDAAQTQAARDMEAARPDMYMGMMYG